MPPRPASTCSRALQRQLASPFETIWVSDALLANAFERYFAATQVPRRRASSTPGPLESRRRLGKRRIGDLNIGHAPSALPDWALPNAVDLSKWKWEAPTLPSVWGAKLEAQRQLAGHWLGQYLVPPPITEEAQPMESPTLDTPLVLLGQFQARVATESVPDLVRACDDICSQLSASERSPEDKGLLAKSLAGVKAALITRFGKSSDEFSLFIQLYSAVVEGMFSAPGENRLLDLDSTDGQELFLGLLAQLRDLPAGDELCRLFELTMKYIPQRLVYERPMQVEDILRKFLQSWADNPWDGQVSEEQISGMAGALKRLSPSRAASIFLAAERLLLQQSGSAEQLYNARYAWLSVLARLPRFGDNALSDAISKLFFSDQALSVRLSSTDLCDILLRHWASTGKIRNCNDVRQLYERLALSGESTYTAALSFSLFKFAKSWQQRIPELVGVLKRTGRLDELVTSFQALTQQSKRSHRRLLRSVAIECDDYRVALELFKLCRRQWGHETVRTDVWTDTVWPHYLEQAVSDPSASLQSIWTILEHCKASGRTVRIAADLAYRIAYSSDISNSKAKRWVTRYVALIRRSGHKLPPTAVTAVWRVVTRDLAAGQWGRTARLDWFIDLVGREAGLEQSLTAHNILRSWRQMVHRVQTRQAVEVGRHTARVKPGGVQSGGKSSLK